jgi:beta-glucosidase
MTKTKNKVPEWSRRRFVQLLTAGASGATVMLTSWRRVKNAQANQQQDTKSLLPEIDRLSLKEQVAQMFMVRIAGHIFDEQTAYPIELPTASQIEDWVTELGVGGVLLRGGSASDVMIKSRLLQSLATIPLLLAADIEEGVGQQFTRGTWFPPPMALSAIARKDLAKALKYAELMGAFSAQESLAIGVNWMLAPVVDVNNNPENPIINIRSFGETPAMVSQLAAAFIRGVHQWPVLTCAKHFPGHGDISAYSEEDLPVLLHSPERLGQIELPPFQRAIAAGVDSVMSAHLLIPEWDRQRPASLSEKILQGQLRKKLGFQGLIVTDSLQNPGIMEDYGAEKAAVMAVEAGADILLTPLNIDAAIKGLYDAVKTGRISQQRIRASVERIWQAKLKVCQESETRQNFSLAPPNSLSQIATTEAMTVVANILRDSQQIGGILPWSGVTQETGRLRNLVVVDDILRSYFLGRKTPAIAIPKQLGYELELWDRNRGDIHINRDDEYSVTLLQLFIWGNAFQGTSRFAQTVQDLFKQLLQTGKLGALVIYGSPYVMDNFVKDLPSEIPYVFTYGQMPTAQAIALETLFQT